MTLKGGGEGQKRNPEKGKKIFSTRAIQGEKKYLQGRESSYNSTLPTKGEKKTQEPSVNEHRGGFPGNSTTSIQNQMLMEKRKTGHEHCAIKPGVLGRGRHWKHWKSTISRSTKDGMKGLLKKRFPTYKLHCLM